MSYSSTFNLKGQALNVPIAAGLAAILLIPLVSIPRPSIETGHPWKVELATSCFVLVSLLMVWVARGLRPATSLLSSRAIRFAFASIALFTLWSGFSVLWANASISVLHHTTSWFLYAAVLFLTLGYFQSTRSVKAVLVAFGAASAIVAVICLLDTAALFQFGRTNGGHRMRYTKYGELLALIAPLLYAVPFYARKTSFKFAWSAAAFMAWLAAMLSLSKGALVAGVAGIAAFFILAFVFAGWKLRKKIVLAAMIWIVLTASVQMSLASFLHVPSPASSVLAVKEDANSVSIPFRIFTWRIAASMALSHPFKGVGADNFGTSFNDARRKYFADDPVAAREVSIAENYMFQRAHNEALQVFAELGIVGLLLFALIGFSFLYPLFARLRRRKKLSPLLIGSLAGMFAFAVSSMFSSFSFRAMQNGVAFFVVFGIGLYELTKHEKGIRIAYGSRETQDVNGMAKWPLPAAAALCVVFHALIGASSFYTLNGQNEPDPSKSREYLDAALKLNPENGAAYYFKGVLEFLEERPGEAVPLLEKSREFGVNALLNYYYASSCHILDDDLKSAADVMSEAVNTFPGSVYARVHYSVILEDAGRAAESERQYAEAVRLNRRQAETWKLVLEDSLLNATDATRNRRDLDKPNELEPRNVIESIFHLSRLRKAAE